MSLQSARIRTDPNEYAPFLFHPEIGIQLEPREFCEAFVEAVGKEAGKVAQARLTIWNTYRYDDRVSQTTYK